MPSGAKRRKAAKKKKEKEASSSATHSQQGDDGGGVNSPTSQEHQDDQHSSNEGDLEVEKREDIPSVQSVAEGTDVNGASAGDSNVVEIDWEFKPEEEDPLSKTVESGKESHEDKSSSSSGRSSSGSDDESFTFEKKVVVIESGEPEKDVLNPAVESGALAEQVKTDESSEVTLATDAASLVNLADLPEVTQVADNFAVATPTEKSYNVVEQTLPIVAPEIISNEVVEHALDSNVPDLGLEENGKGKISELTEVVTDVGSQSTKKEVSSTKVENSAVSSNVETFLSHEEEDKLLPPSSGPVNSSGNGTEQSKDYAGNESSDKKPLVAPAPRPVQTSWTGCCGLFELFTGSSR